MPCTTSPDRCAVGGCGVGGERIAAHCHIGVSEGFANRGVVKSKDISFLLGRHVHRDRHLAIPQRQRVDPRLCNRLRVICSGADIRRGGIGINHCHVLPGRIDKGWRTGKRNGRRNHQPLANCQVHPVVAGANAPREQLVNQRHVRELGGEIRPVRVRGRRDEDHMPLPQRRKSNGRILGAARRSAGSGKIIEHRLRIRTGLDIHLPIAEDLRRPDRIRAGGQTR